MSTRLVTERDSQISQGRVVHELVHGWHTSAILYLFHLNSTNSSVQRSKSYRVKKGRTILRTEGFCINDSIPPLAIICWAICIIMGLFKRLARSGMPPAPPPAPPPMFLNMSAIPPRPPAPGVAPVVGEVDRSGVPDIGETLSLPMRASELVRPDLRPAFVGSSSRPRRKEVAAAE